MTRTRPDARFHWIATLAAIALAAAVGARPSVASADEGDPNPYTQPNESWISISGTVKDVGADRFLLNFGKGTVIVEMDDGDRDSDAYQLIPGDKVTVYGRIDDDFFERTKIEASSVYVEKLGTYFWSSAEDEEDLFFVATATPIVVSSAVVQGRVTKVDDGEFTLDTGPRTITVEVDRMPYDPLDDEGYQKIRVGDVVRATGQVDYDLFEGREFEAESLIKLSRG